jgi:hypothetical protein
MLAWLAKMRQGVDATGEESGAARGGAASVRRSRHARHKKKSLV